MNSVLSGVILFGAIALAAPQPSRTLETELLDQDMTVLAGQMRELGDPVRGAKVFYRPFLGCTKCHATGDSQIPTLGPDLSKLGKQMTDAELIDAILRPSKSIRKGFETITIAMTDGKSFTGLLAEERADEVILRDPSQDGRPIKVPKREIEERKDNAASAMPSALINGLASRQEFLDLVRYLREIADGGPERAKLLRPDPSQVAGLTLPEYEARIDHAGMIADLGPENLKRGEAIYDRVCINCHGTRDKAGSLPTSLRFSKDRFKNGSDPLSLYRTLTHGYGQMSPQTWMVPSQKYDVIHYLRETFLKPDNPSQYLLADRAYLDRLPKGTTRGPEPSNIEPWSAMDYGPTLTATYELGNDSTNFAYKGIAVRLDAGPGGISRGRHWAVYDHDTMRLAGAWSGTGFIDWNGINFNGIHAVHPHAVGEIELANPGGPGWGNPENGSFKDPRIKGRDGRHHGPLPRSLIHYLGQYRHGDRVVLSYTVGTTKVLETPAVETGTSPPVFGRILNVGARDRTMVLQVARGPKGQMRRVEAGRVHGVYLSPKLGDSTPGLLAVASPSVPGADWTSTPEGDLRLSLPAGTEPLRFALRLARVPAGVDSKAMASSMAVGLSIDLGSLTRGGPSRWPETLKTPIEPGRDDGPFAVDTFRIPWDNPWLCQMRLGGFDFLDGGRRAAVCTWDGDVWIVGGLDAPSGELTWRRIASGLFQPLGVKVQGGQIYVTCRDQIVILNDLNGDGETDFYENFNSDHQVTEHFHEFAMDLQADPAGNLYYAKAARHAKTALVPQHGTLLRVSRDGLRTDILARGFRAPNGVCLNEDGTFFLTDQEGHWNPKNRINHVREGGFYGNMWGYHDVTDTSDSAMEPPVCWITNAFDRSPTELVRVTTDAPGWAPLKGSLLNLSYGNGKVFTVLAETVAGVMQGGMSPLPVPASPTGLMRGRFGPRDGQLYACGLFAWASNQSVPGGFCRIRATGKPMNVPVGLHAIRAGLRVTFTDPMDPSTASDPSNFAVKTWSLKRTENYGSKHYDEKAMRVAGASLSPDGRTLTLSLPEIQPTWSMEVQYRLKGLNGSPVEGVIHNTIHRLGD